MSEPVHQRRSARPLVIGFAVLAVLIAAAGYWAWGQQAQSMQRQAERSLVAVVELKAGQITAWLKERRGDAETLMGDPLLSAAVADMLAGRDADRTTARLQAYLNEVQRNYDYLDVVLLSPSGDVLMRAPSTATHPVGGPGTALAAAATTTRRVVPSDLYLDAEGHARLELAAPILSDPGGVIATVILHVDPGRYLYPLIQNWPLPSKSGETLLVERRGDQVVYLNELRHRKNTAFKLTAPLNMPDLPAAMAARGQRGIAPGIDYRGMPVLAAFQPVPGTPWFIIAKEDTDEVLGAIRTRGWLTAGFALLLALLAGAGTLFLWRARETQASAEIRENEEKFRTLFENMTVGVALHELVVDAQGVPLDYRILDLNPAYEKQTGVSVGQVRGKLSRDAYGTAEPPFLAEYAQTAQTGEPLRFQTYFEPLAKHFDITVVAQGRGRFATLFEDITERKQAEEELRASERKFRETIQALDEGYYSVTMDGRLLDHNPAFNTILGIDPAADLRGRSMPDFWWDRSDRTAYVGQLNRDGLIRDYLVRAKRTDGSPLIVLVSAHLVRDERGEVARIDGSIVDFTARKAAEDEIERLNADLERRVEQRTAQLQAANEELEAFAYTVSHDLRAPLRHVSGFTDLLVNEVGADLDDKGRHYADVITDATRQMGVLIDDLLQFSRAGRAALQLETFDMDEVLEEALQPLRQDSAERDIDWVVASLPHVSGDRALLRQVWANLLGNAVKFSSGLQKARIEVGCTETADEVAFFVRDNGVGFDMEYADRLFGVFQRLHRADEFEGTGIGLANVQRIVARHGGRTWAQAKVEEGATFWFSLPRHKGDAP